MLNEGEKMSKDDPVKKKEVFCWNCGYKSSEDVCPNCGAELVRPDDLLKKTGEGEKSQFASTYASFEVGKPFETINVVTIMDVNLKRGIDVNLKPIKEVVTKHFKLRSFIASETLIATLEETPTPDFSERFNAFLNDLDAAYKGLKALARVNEETKKIILFFFVHEPKPRRNKIYLHLGLFLLTCITVTWFAYNYTWGLIYDLKVIPEQVNILGISLPNIWVMSLQYTFALLGIIILHEFGHYFTSRHHKVQASLPYVIPFFPDFFGTLGAVIKQDEIARNRNVLFDIGISGPIVSFVVSIIVSVVGIWNSIIIDDATYQQLVSSEKISSMPFVPPLLLLILLWVASMNPLVGSAVYGTQYHLLMHPLTFAGFIGLIITGLNFLPVSQLDGGHVARAMFGEKNHKYLSFAIFFILLFLGLYVFALFIFFTLMFFKHPGPIDDITPLTRQRRIIGILGIMIAILCMPWPVDMLDALLGLL